MAALTVQQIGFDHDPTYAAVSASDTVQADPAGLILARDERRDLAPTL
jgi:hypothetical protein